MTTLSELETHTEGSFLMQLFGLDKSRIIQISLLQFA